MSHPLPGGNLCSNQQTAAAQYQTKPRLGAGQKQREIKLRNIQINVVFFSWPRAERFINESKQSLRKSLRTGLLPRGPKTGKYTTFV